MKCNICEGTGLYKTGLKCNTCKGTGLQNDYFDQADCFWKPKCKSCLGTGEASETNDFKYCPYCGKPIKINYE